MASNLLQRLRNSIRGLIQRYAPTAIKRYQWNREYANGRWRCLDSMANDVVYPHVEKHVKGGSILDLGCGPGTVGNELNAGAYGCYTGIDISDIAIEKARVRTEENGRPHKNRYHAADILEYQPEQQYDVVLFGDSIYYFSHAEIAEILNRYALHLTPDGVFIVRTWLLKERHREIIRNIERTFDVVEKRHYHELQMCVIAFRPAAKTLELRTRSAIPNRLMAIIWALGGSEWLPDTLCWAVAQMV